MARCVTTLCLLALLAGTNASDNRLDLLRRLAEKPWLGRWHATPRLHRELKSDSRYVDPDGRYVDPDSRYVNPDNRYVNPDSRYVNPDNRYVNPDNRYGNPENRYVGSDSRYLNPDENFWATLSDGVHNGGSHSHRNGGTAARSLLESPVEKRVAEDDPIEEFDKTINDETFRDPSEKRSAVATALNAGRRRRQPAPALGKAVKPYVGVGVLNDVGSFFDSLRDNLETLASLSPQERATLFQDPPTVVHAPAHAGGSGGGVGFRKLHALRPLRPTGNIRSYNRRSLVEAEDVYPGANHHDPGLLWTGLG